MIHPSIGQFVGDRGSADTVISFNKTWYHSVGGCLTTGCSLDHACVHAGWWRLIRCSRELVKQSILLVCIAGVSWHCNIVCSPGWLITATFLNILVTWLWLWSIKVTQDIISFFSEFFLRKHAPKLHQLDLLESNGKSVKLISIVAGKWEKIATRLYLETHDIERIERNCFYKAESSCRTVFMEWLDGKYRAPVTWDTLIKALEEANFSKVVRDLVFILSSIQSQPLDDHDN